MEATAKLVNCPTSPRKMRLVVDMIRGINAEKALNILKYSPKEASKRVEKLLMSAIANWQSHNEGEKIEDNELYIKEAFVNGGRMLKRQRPAPQGRAHRIRKRSNHVTLIVDSKIDWHQIETEDTAQLEQESQQKETIKTEEKS